MRHLPFAVALACAAALPTAPPAAASTFHEVIKACPIGGERFPFNELGSISAFGGLPDGMPIGSGRFPIALPQCPGNGLVMYKDYSKEEIARLTPVVVSAEYRAWRAADTPYYLAYRLAVALGDRSAPWLLLSATWEAKERGEADPRARRYDAEFVTAIAALPADYDTREAMALTARAANALRTLDRFEEAERMRAGIRVDPALFAGEGAAREREGWTGYLAKLAAPIARRDVSRAPVDLIGDDQAVFRCLEPEYTAKHGEPAPAPLSAFERGWCARPALAKPIRARKAALAR